MSVETKSNGSLRLRCDGPECDRKFVPLRPLLDAKQLRTRAALYGWHRGARILRPGEEIDLCSECGKAPP